MSLFPPVLEPLLQLKLQTITFQSQWWNPVSTSHLLVEPSLQHPQQNNSNLCLHASSDRELTILLEALLKLPVTLRTRAKLSSAFLHLSPIELYCLEAHRTSIIPLSLDTKHRSCVLSPPGQGPAVLFICSSHNKLTVWHCSCQMDALPPLFHLILIITLSFFMPILQMGKLRLTEVKQYTQNYSASMAEYGLQPMAE